MQCDSVSPTSSQHFLLASPALSLWVSGPSWVCPQDPAPWWQDLESQRLKSLGDTRRASGPPAWHLGLWLGQPSHGSLSKAPHSLKASPLSVMLQSRCGCLVPVLFGLTAGNRQPHLKRAARLCLEPASPGPKSQGARTLT